MNPNVLANVALGFAPLIDRQRMCTATRLTVMPLRPDAQLDAAELLAAVTEVWPAGAATVILNVRNESLLQALLALPIPNHVLLELPAFMASDATNRVPLLALKQQGNRSLLNGCPAQPLPAELLTCFKYAIFDPDAKSCSGASVGVQLGTNGGPNSLPRLHSGLRNAQDIEASFALGAVGVIGWPMQGPYEPPAGTVQRGLQTDLQVIVELMLRVDQGDDVGRLEQTLKRDPSLAFKLLRYLNSAAFGLPVEVASFRHAIMLLGYSRMKRWLALLLVTASKDHSMRPIMFAALRRGILMEELAKSASDTGLADEMFICGLFSLLDHMLQQPFSQLLAAIPVPDRVHQALTAASGPYQPYLELLRAIEDESIYDYRSAAEQLMLGADEINACVMRALAKAAQLE